MTVALNPDRGLLFVRYAKSLAIAKGRGQDAAAFAASQAQWRNRDAVVSALKAGVGALGRDDAAGQLAQPGVDFSDFIRPLTILGRLQGLRRVPSRVRVITSDSATIGYWVGERLPIPLSAMSLTGEVMEPLKVGAMAVLTNELLQTSDLAAEPLISRELARAAVARMDVSFIDPTSSGTTDIEPASVTSGATPIPSSGSTLAAIDSDLDAAINALDVAGSDLVFAHWVMRPKTALYLSRLRGTGGALAHPNISVKGGTLLGLPVVVSAHIGNVESPLQSYITLLDAAAVTIVDDGATDIQLARGAAVEMENAPTQDGEAGTGASVVSLFQVDSSALKIVRHINWRLNRSGFVQVIREVDF